MGPLHLTTWGPFISTRSIAADSALIRIQTDVVNENHVPTTCRITTCIIDKNGNQVKEVSVDKTIPGDATVSLDQECAISHPLLWDLDSPYLYKAFTTVTVQGQTSHEMPSTFGVRTISVDAERGFRLNGKMIKLTGTGFGGENACVGTASLDRAEYRKLDITKSFGFNTFRIQNCAPSAAFLDACDNVGMLVPYPFYEYPIIRTYPWPDGTEPGWRSDVAAMIQRARNHPSVIMYLPEVLDYGWHNYEVRGPKPIAARASFTRSQDPTRFVCRNFLFSKNKHEYDINWPDLDENGAQVDIVGDVPGGSGGYHDRHPSAVIFGWDAVDCGRLVAWRKAIANSWFIGGTTGVNTLSWQYRGECGWPGTLCGMKPSGFQFDICGFPYANAYLNRIVYKILNHKNKNPDLVVLVKSPFRDSTGDFEQIPSWTWPGCEKAKLNVAVYSSCEKVTLLLNGRELGAKSENVEDPGPSANQGWAAQWSIPYEAGTLKAIGFIGGIQVAEYTLQSAAKPAAIRLSADRPVIHADSQDLCYVTVEVTDANGIWTPYPLLDQSSDASHPQFGQKHLHFTIDGPGSIVGIENALSYDHESLRKPEHDTHLGRCLVAIRSSYTPGTITLKASGDGLTSGSVTVSSKSSGSVSLLTAPPPSPAAPARPNFIVILIDDMGYGDISPYGSKLNRTPALDRMAAEGMKLTSFYYAAPVCTPSRAQMMTGCYAKRVSLPDVLFPASRSGISSAERTVAELLKQQGYATMCVGKWHLGDQPEFLPTRHGFDQYVGLPYSNDMGGSGEPGDRRPPLPLLRQQRVAEAPVQQDKLVELVYRRGREVHHRQQGPPLLPLPAAHGRSRAAPSGQSLPRQVV